MLRTPLRCSPLKRPDTRAEHAGNPPSQPPAVSAPTAPPSSQPRLGTSAAPSVEDTTPSWCAPEVVEAVLAAIQMAPDVSAFPAILLSKPEALAEAATDTATQEFVVKTNPFKVPGGLEVGGYNEMNF
eukprot:gene5884-biopygen1970